MQISIENHMISGDQVNGDRMVYLGSGDVYLLGIVSSRRPVSISKSFRLYKYLIGVDIDHLVHTINRNILK